ncbi:amidohydrolase family protein [Pseudoxanthomonas daejeonensis]|uniref:metal-dependent hydrolase family protein n=1 Tax=Pseudoxanthomonas daejeonensis TaxID=266062 RepID=UPI001F546B24|nr:amidohydrolase family protein [Pseudoxanthomonas daejeonensis]UNK58316.1 amidohydrolase family protein [Pseudoxanthomonas daejeonensis]
MVFLLSGLTTGNAGAHDDSLALAAAQAAGGQAAAPGAPGSVLFRNVRIFDGTSGRVSGPSDVLVRGNLIERIAPGQVPEPATKVIEGGGRVLMPGLIDAHWHSMMAAPSLGAILSGDHRYLTAIAAAESTRTLMRGFTSVRDVGGNSFGLKQAVDEGVLPGPRIYASGAMISVTSGHGDFRQPGDLPRTMGAPGPTDLEGDTAIADSPDEVRMRVREQLMRGAAQIKLTAGGGVSSPHSPLDAITFTPAELRAATEAAGNWGTYVTVHAYTAEAVRQAIEAGVKVIEHGSLMDDATARLMAQRGIWLSIQPFPDELAEAFPPGSFERKKAEEVFAGNNHAYDLAKKYRLKTAWGTDVLFSAALAGRQGAILASLTRWYTPAETLVMATGTNGELLQLSGKRNPYPGRVGVVQEGAFADLLLVDGDPTVDISLVARPEQAFKVIMKDGRIYKDTLGAQVP